MYPRTCSLGLPESYKGAANGLKMVKKESGGRRGGMRSMKQLSNALTLHIIARG